MKEFFKARTPTWGMSLPPSSTLAPRGGASTCGNASKSGGSVRASLFPSLPLLPARVVAAKRATPLGNRLLLRL